MTDPKYNLAHSLAYLNAGVDGILGIPAHENRERISYVGLPSTPASRTVDCAHCRSRCFAVRVARTGLHFIRPDRNGSKRYDDVYRAVDGRSDHVG